MTDDAEQVWQTQTPAETMALGRALGERLVGGLCVGLVGELGAGKTQLVKGIAAGNASDDDPEVTSPTFALIHEYLGRFRLYHLDAYRLADSASLLDLGFEELVSSEAVVVVEWADRVEAALPVDRLWITATHTGALSRSFSFRAKGELATGQLAALSACFH